MSARGKARKRALDILFESEARGVDPSVVLAERAAIADPPMNPYVSVLVSAALENRRRVDELIERYAHGWTLDRLPAVDRAILRVGVVEVLFLEEIPDQVALAEATTLARDLSTDDSPTFVNGVLAAISRDKGALLA